MHYKKYKEHGYLISEKLINENDISNLRDDLEIEFKDKKLKYQKNLKDFTNKYLVKKIIDIYSKKNVIDIISNFKENINKEVFLLPPFEVHKNYHVDLQSVHGWHRDCGGELKYDYCKNIIFRKDYFFSKVGIYLQENSNFGGAIDIIKLSHKYFSKYTSILRKIRMIPFRLVTLIHKLLTNLYLYFSDKFFMRILNAKKLHPEKGAAVFFDSRLIHRGSPINIEKHKEVNFLKGEFSATVPKKYDKYSIYCQLGTMEAIDSYMYDRLKRKDGKLELKMWIENAEFISIYNKDLSNKILRAIDPIVKKYSNYIN